MNSYSANIQCFEISVLLKPARNKVNILILLLPLGDTWRLVTFYKYK